MVAKHDQFGWILMHVKGEGAAANIYFGNVVASFNELLPAVDLLQISGTFVGYNFIQSEH